MVTRRGFFGCLVGAAVSKPMPAPHRSQTIARAYRTVAPIVEATASLEAQRLFQYPDPVVELADRLE